MKVTVPQLQEMRSPFLQFWGGDPQAEAYRPWPPEIAPPGALVYVSSQQQLEIAIEAPAGIIIALANLVTGPRKLAPQQALFTTPAINAAMAQLNPFFDPKPQRWSSGISPQAQIHPTAQIGANVSVGAFTIIGEMAKIGDGTRIGPHCVIEKEAQIGENSLLHPFVMIGGECELGARCEIHPHTTIGADGFGYVTSPDKKHFKVPQLGKVVVGADVEIGANCTVDRATLHQTVIGAGSKIDNLCHIAHNCTIGQGAMIAAGFAMAGSCSVGNFFTCGGKVVFSDHCHVTDNVTIGGNSAVTKDVTQPGIYVGYPLQPFRDGLRTIASLTSVPEMRKQLAQLQQKIDDKQSSK